MSELSAPYALHTGASIQAALFLTVPAKGNGFGFAQGYGSGTDNLIGFSGHGHCGRDINRGIDGSLWNVDRLAYFATGEAGIKGNSRNQAGKLAAYNVQISIEIGQKICQGIRSHILAPIALGLDMKSAQHSIKNALCGALLP